MPQSPTIIVDAQGVEHEFPPGFDPVQAGAIVRARTSAPGDPLEAVRGATGISSNTLTDRAIRALPVGGATVGGFMGGGRWNPLGMVTAGAGGVLGESAAQLANTVRGRMDLVPPTLGEQVGRMALTGTGNAALEGAFRGAGAGIGRAGRWAMNNALRPGLRVMDEAGQPITKDSTLSGRFPDVDIVGEAIRRRLPIRNNGLRRTQKALEQSRSKALAMVKASAEKRPRVAGLLEEGRTPVMLAGPEPIPRGGSLAVQRAAATQRVPFNLQRARQGMSPIPAVTQFYGGQPAKTAASATADVVEGRGVVLLRGGGSATPAALLPGRGQMIGTDEALAPVLRYRASLKDTALPKTKRLWDKLIAEYRAAYADPINALVAQKRKDFLADKAERMYRTGKGPETAMFTKLLADGYRKAVETRVPGIRAVNHETQTQLALRESLLKALDEESRSRRYTFAGALDNPRLWGGISAATRSAERTARAVPTFVRSLFLATDPSAEDEGP
mgnify:CR=1 FL=1